MDPKGKVALVTGASGGIGKAIALALARKGAKLLLVARGEEALALARKECQAAGSPKVTTLSADLSTSQGVDATILAAVREFDGFDILVNNAGGSRPSRPITEVTEEEFHKEVALNLAAPFFLTQAAVKVMRRRGGGQVVQVASGLAYRGLPNWSLYAATKFGLRGFTECVREEVSKEGIKVGIVAPGYTETGFFEHWPGGQERSFDGALQPEDVAHAALCLIEQGPDSDIRVIQVRNRKSP